MPNSKFPLSKVSKVHRIGGSLMVTLPSEFVHAYSISKGDNVSILVDHVLKVSPMKEVGVKDA